MSQSLPPGIEGQEIGPNPLERLYRAEAELIALVCGGDATERINDLREVGRTDTARQARRGTPSGLRARLAWVKRLPGGRRLANLTRPR